MCEGSSGNGLLYAARAVHLKRTTLRTYIQRKQYHKRTTLRTLKILLRIIVSRKVSTIALEQSAMKAVIRHAIDAIWHGYVENPAAKYS